MPKKRRIFIVFLLLLSVFNYSRIVNKENIRPVQFLSIFAMGALAGILIRDLVNTFRNKENEVEG